MGYQLGIDLGTTYTAAAVRRGPNVEICTLSASNPVMPSVMALRDDGEVIVGDAAVRRAQADPTRMAREFKRRLGDPAPMMVGRTPFSAEALMAGMLRSVIDIVVRREGGTADAVVLTHPANYGPYKLEMMREVARLGGLDLRRTTMLTEPQAAAISYSARDRVEPGAHVAVYDLGGGTFDAAVLRKTETGFVLVGDPEGLDRFGGIDIDAAIIAHVDQMMDGALDELDQDDPAVQSGLHRLREDCRSAKEALSDDSDTTIDVAIAGVHQRIRLTRQEVEDMIRPRLRETTDALARTIRSADLAVDDIGKILMVGGSSRIPLVSDLVARTMGRPVAVDAHPKFAIALGAAAYAPDEEAAAPPPPPPPPPSPPAPESAPPPPPIMATPFAPPPPPPARPGRISRRRRVSYELPSWTLEQRAALERALVAARVLHEWEGDVLVVAKEHEAGADRSIAEVEAQLGIDEVDDEVNDDGVATDSPSADRNEDPEGQDEAAFQRLSGLYFVAKRLERRPLDRRGLDDLANSVGVLDDLVRGRPPYGLDHALWERACNLAMQLADSLLGRDEPDPVTAKATAGELRDLLEPFI